MSPAAEWIAATRRFWNASFDKLDQHLKHTKGTRDDDRR